MDISTDAVDEVVLALLYLNLCGENRAWKSLDWDALNRLHEKGFIGDPVSRAKSVWLTDEGLALLSQNRPLLAGDVDAKYSVNQGLSPGCMTINCYMK
jgi:hypothetical protein